MTEPTQKTGRFKLSQDWLATLVGLAMVGVIGAGLLGPGPHSLTLTAAPGETVSVQADVLDGWRVTGELEADTGAQTLLDDAPVRLTDSADLAYTCTSDASDLSVDTRPALNNGDGESTITLVNTCDHTVTLAFSIDAAIVWPLFGIFD